MNKQEKGVLRDSCIYNDGVICKNKSQCYRCGWNPKVARRRAAETRIELVNDLPRGVHPSCSKCIFLWKYRK